MDLQTLTAAEALEVHNALVRDFASSSDPISPPGVRSADLLESAVARQHTGLGGVLKYPTAVPNAATLLYGICCDHPFHNGNKRTALVSALVHLDRNRLALYNTTQDDLYKLMIQVASHEIGVRRRRKSRSRPPLRRNQDDEGAEIAHWLGSRAARLSRGERLINYRELRRILESFGYYLENPRHNGIDIVRYETVKKGIFNRREVRVPKRIGNIGWPGEHREIAKGEVRHIREICRLREEDGVDSDSFYDYASVIDSYVNRYRKVLRALAKV